MSGHVQGSVFSNHADKDIPLSALERQDDTSTNEHLGSLLRRKVPYERVLEEHKKEGLTVGRRAYNLGVSPKTYDRYLDEYGLPRHQMKSSRKFTDEELQRRIDAGQTYKQIAEELHVHYLTVVKRAVRCGFKAVKQPAHYKLRDAELRRLHELQVTSAEAAALAESKVCSQTVLKGWKRLGLSPHFKGKRRKTTDEEYKELHAKGHTRKEMSRMLDEDYETTSEHCRDLKLKPNVRCKYNLSPQLLRQLHEMHLTEKEAAVAIGIPAKSYVVIGRRWRELGLSPHFHGRRPQAARSPQMQ